MLLKEEILFNAGIYDEEKIILEGIKFFKTSNKLKKVVENIYAKSNRFPQDSPEKEKLVILADKINKLISKFSKIEDEFANGGDKKTLKNEYEFLKKSFSEIVSLSNEQFTKRLLSNIGMAASMAASFIIPSKILGVMGEKFGVLNTKTGVNELNPFLKAAGYMGTGALLSIGSRKLQQKIYGKDDPVDKANQAMKDKEI